MSLFNLYMADQEGYLNPNTRRLKELQKELSYKSKHYFMDEDSARQWAYREFNRRDIDIDDIPEKFWEEFVIELGSHIMPQ